MRNRFFLWIASALLLFAGCINDEIVEEQPTSGEGSKITLTASVPGETAQTRLSLTSEQSSKNIIVTWKEGDRLHFYFKQGETIFGPIDIQLTVDNITDEGKKATFTVDIPEGIDGTAAYTLYALHGTHSMIKGDINILVNVSPVGFLPFYQLNDVPIMGEVEVAAGASIGIINFEHLGTLQCLTMRNSSDTDFTFTPSLVFANQESGTDWYYTVSDGAMPFYNLTSKTVENQNIQFFPPDPNSGVITIPRQSAAQLMQWVRPISNTTAPEIKLNAQPPIGEPIVSVNSKRARNNPMQTGSAYHLYALWDGTSLYFTDDTFAPPVNPLSYVAKYNINPAGDGFVTDSTACNVSGYFNGANAAHFTDITIDGKRYHLPSIGEWRSIVPQDPVLVKYSDNTSYDNQSETVKIADRSYTMTSDFRNHSATKTTYALRYKGTNLLSAWKYEYIDGNTNDCHLKITSRSIYDQSVTIDNIANESFWDTNTENDFVRCFPACGYKLGDSYFNYVGSRGWYLSLYESNRTWEMHFSDVGANSDSGSAYDTLFPVRLFTSDN